MDMLEVNWQFGYGHVHIYLNWLISSFNDFRALARTAFVLAKLIFQSSVDGSPVPALCRKSAVLHFKAVLNSP